MVSLALSAQTGLQCAGWTSGCEAECKRVEVECDGECVCVSKRSLRERLLESVPKKTCNLRVNLTSRSPNCYGQVKLLNSTTQWPWHTSTSVLVSTNPMLELHSNTSKYFVVVKYSMFQPLYSVLGDDVLSIPSYAGEMVVRILPVVDGKQVSRGWD